MKPAKGPVRLSHDNWETIWLALWYTNHRHPDERFRSVLHKIGNNGEHAAKRGVGKGK